MINQSFTQTSLPDDVFVFLCGSNNHITFDSSLNPGQFPKWKINNFPSEENDLMSQLGHRKSSPKARHFQRQPEKIILDSSSFHHFKFLILLLKYSKTNSQIYPAVCKKRNHSFQMKCHWFQKQQSRI